ncbi:MAG: MCP four helix bundle domain-containing protein [Thiomargarita sp.]|nr:MCP four helix bundle domain-containing protein [Thiomargarita sp.]
MFSELKISTKLYLSFWLMIILVVTVGILTLFQMYSSYKLLNRLHSHPVVINNVVYEINLNIVNIQSRLKEIIFLKDTANIEVARQAITSSKETIFQNFEMIEIRFRGNKQPFDNVSMLFKNWISILNEIIALQKKGVLDKATIIFNGKNIQHFIQLEKALKGLTNSTKNQADQFLEETNSQTKNTLWISIIMMVIIFSGIWIVFIISSRVAQTVNFGLGVVDALAKGNLTQQIKCDSNVETEKLLQILDKMQIKLGERIKKVEKVEIHLQKLEEEKSIAEKNERIAETKQLIAEQALQSSRGADTIFSSLLFTDGSEGLSLLYDDSDSEGLTDN